MVDFPLLATGKLIDEVALQTQGKIEAGHGFNIPKFVFKFR